MQMWGFWMSGYLWFLAFHHVDTPVDGKKFDDSVQSRLESERGETYTPNV